MQFHFKIEVGTVFQMPFPFEDNPNEFKKRPVIVLEEYENELTVLVCPSTTKIHRAKEPFNILILKDSQDGVTMGLEYDSVLRINQIRKFKKEKILKYHVRRRGKASKSLVKQILENWNKYLKTQCR